MGPLLGSAARDGGQDGDVGVLPDRGLHAAGEADVLVVDVDVDEPGQRAVGDQPPGDAAVAGLEVVDHLADGGALGLDGLLAAGVGAQDGGDGHGCHGGAPDRVVNGTARAGSAVVGNVV